MGNGDCAASILREIKMRFLHQRQTSEDQNKETAPPPTPPAHHRVKLPDGTTLDLPIGLGEDADSVVKEAVRVCLEEHAAGEFGLACLTAQSQLFSIGTHLSSSKAQDDLFTFIGNLGIGLGF
uniref:Uncharacterized protein n=1 Tax=Octactis speculum TaxID=3111310 RepID=A0A7S2DAU0_9STRA